MEAITLGVLTKKLLDLIRSARGGQWSAVLTQLAAAVIGVALVILVAHSDLTGLQSVAGINLAHINVASQILVGLGAGLGGSGLVNDVVKAVDNTTTTALPSLLTGKLPDPVEAAQPLIATVLETTAPKRTNRRRTDGKP